MQSWLAKKLISCVMGAHPRRATSGRRCCSTPPTCSSPSPASNSWSGVFRGKDEVERWLQRLAASASRPTPTRSWPRGSPGARRSASAGHDHLRRADGERVYENRFVIWGRLAWGRLKDYEVYEDTEKADALDEYLAAHRPDRSAVALTGAPCK